MKKRYLKIFLVVLLAFTVSSMIVQIKNGIESKRDIEESRMVLPQFQFTSLDGNLFRDNKINNDQIIINYFHPECGHCQFQVDELKKLSQIQDVLILMISTETTENLSDFVMEYQLEGYPEIVVLHDPEDLFVQVFGESNVPTIMIYQDRELKKIYRGETKYQAITKILNEPDLRLL